MAFDGTEKRLKAFVLVKDRLESRLRFGAVKVEIPAAPPGAQDLDAGPVVYLGNAPETVRGITNAEKDSDFRIAVLVFLRANENIELEKIRQSGEVERALQGLQNEAAFASAGLTSIDVVTIDRGPLALATYGLEGDMPPQVGVVRLDLLITFTYEAFE